MMVVVDTASLFNCCAQNVSKQFNFEEYIFCHIFGKPLSLENDMKYD
jgi:hypothetical protein